MKRWSRLVGHPMAWAVLGQPRNESKNVLTLFASFGEREVRDEPCNKLHEFLMGSEGRKRLAREEDAKVPRQKR